MVLLEHGYPMTNAKFASLLRKELNKPWRDTLLLTAADCDVKTAHDLTRRLRAEGYLTATPGSHSRGFSLKGLPKYLVVKTRDQMDEMRKTYFNPLARIAHHVGLIRSNLALDEVQMGWN